MVQLSTIFNAISKSIKSNEPAVDFAKDDALTSYAQRSENFAAAHSKRGKKGINQDRFVVSELGVNTVFCGVFDGHGPWGHHAAKTVRRLMPPALLRSRKEVVSTHAKNSEFDDVKHDMQFDIWKRSYYMACAAIDQELERQTKIDSFYSGSTALALVREGDLVIIANVGDSRAVLASVSDEGELVATQLTTDLKPNLPSERDRIAQSKGRVYSCPDEPGVHRVWQPNGPMLSGPGLAVSRAFGDYFIKDYGLISEPEVTKICISSKDEFVILATDGVWDVASNQEAAEIVFLAPERALSAKRLVEHVARAWKWRGRINVMDDVSVVCLFFHRLDES